MATRKTQAKACRNCRSCSPVYIEDNGKRTLSKDTGYCRRFPPAVTGPNQSSFPPVKLDDWACDEWRRG